MATTETSELFCLICDLNLEITSCMNIFYTSLPRNGELLASFVLRVLRSAESDLRSSYMCSQCYNLFQMLEQAQWTAANIRSEILKVYRSGDKEKITKELVNGNTETTVLDVDNKIFMESFIPDDKLVIANTLSQLKDISSLRPVNDEASQSIDHGSMVEDHLVEQSLNVSNVDTTADISHFKVIAKVGSKCNAKNLLVPDNVRSNVSNIVSTSREQDDCVKIEKLNSESNNKDIIGNKVSSCVMDSTNLSVLKDDTFNKSFKAMTRLMTNDATTSLSRQEKMALYIRQCQMCSRLFKSTNDLELHLLKHGGSRPYRCRKCKERFNDISLANIHAMEMHIEEKDIVDVATEPCEGEIVDFMNDDCIFPEEVLRMSDNEEQDDFEWKEASDIIVEIKENSENIKGNQLDQSNSNSDACKQVSSDSSQASWKSGRISKYSLKPLKHSCPTCGKKWRTSAELKTHMKSHSSLRPYMCEKCGQAYKHKHALEIHIGMHNGINPFQCSFCNKCFTQKGALMRHLPMHTGETPYQCELCGKRFVHHTSYNMHALSHTGKKSYRCHVCDLSLLSTSHLKRHMRVHTGEKPYSCSLCGKRFAERYNLFAHQKIHDPAEIIAKEAKKMQYKCEQCMVLFDKKQKLDDHVKQQHSLGIDAGNDRKWTDTTIDIDPHQVIELPKFYAPQSQNQNSIKMDTQNNLMVGQTWQQLNYQKLQSIDGVTKVLQSQNPLTQIGTNSLAVTLDNHRMLMEAGYNRNLLPNGRALNGNHVPTDRTQI